jgi:hypothetical protein
VELTLLRTYFPDGTNGALYHDTKSLVCHTIELPWLENRRNVSCIPEGRYVLQRRFTAKRSEHLVVCGVPGRQGILLHPANEALLELRGCIAPVTTLIGAGRGIHSRMATEKLQCIVFAALEQNEEVYLTIKSN